MYTIFKHKKLKTILIILFILLSLLFLFYKPKCRYSKNGGQNTQNQQELIEYTEIKKIKESQNSSNTQYYNEPVTINKKENNFLKNSLIQKENAIINQQSKNNNKNIDNLTLIKVQPKSHVPNIKQLKKPQVSKKQSLKQQQQNIINISNIKNLNQAKVLFNKFKKKGYKVFLMKYKKENKILYKISNKNIIK